MVKQINVKYFVNQTEIHTAIFCLAQEYELFIFNQYKNLRLCLCPVQSFVKFRTHSELILQLQKQADALTISPNFEKYFAATQLVYIQYEIVEIRNQCLHSQTQTRIYCNVCNKFFNCWRCHDDSLHKLVDLKVVCKCCENEIDLGSPSNTCARCGNILYEFKCNECHEYQEQDFKNHKCRSRFEWQTPDDMKADCPICFGQTTIDDYIKLDCSHVFHKTCLFHYLAKNPVKCPLDKHSIAFVSNFQEQLGVLKFQSDLYNQIFLNITQEDISNSIYHFITLFKSQLQVAQKKLSIVKKETSDLNLLNFYIGNLQGNNKVYTIYIRQYGKDADFQQFRNNCKAILFEQQDHQ